MEDGLSTFPTSAPTSWSEDHVPFDELMGIGGGGLSLLDTPYLVEEWDLPSPPAAAWKPLKATMRALESLMVAFRGF